MNNDGSTRTRDLINRLIGRKGIPAVDLLAPGKVVAVLGSADANQPQAQLVFSMMVNLLNRLFPVVQELDLVMRPGARSAVRFPRWAAETLEDHVRQVCSAGSGEVKCSVRSEMPVDANLVIQAGRGIDEVSSPTTLYVGSSGWEAYLDWSSSRIAAGPANPVGAYGAACMAVAEIWKELLSRHKEISGQPIFPLTDALTFSTFTYRAGDHQPNPQLPDNLDMDSLTAIGLGAGGGATIYTLASGPQLRGSLSLVDPDEIETSNLNRYVFAAREDVTLARKKVHVLQELLGQFPKLTVRAHPDPFAAVANELKYEYVAAAVHSRVSRREIQYETPKVLWDAGATEDGQFWIWRLLFGKSECMWCKHPPDAGDPEQEAAKQLSAVLGLRVETWERKLRDNESFTADEIAQLERPAGAAWDPPEEGERFGSWYAAQCGRMDLPELDEEIPVPFAPVMAGILIAGEIVKQFHFPRFTLESYYWNTLMGQFIRRKKPEHRSPRTDCRICQDPDYRDQYERKWGVKIEPKRMS